MLFDKRGKKLGPVGWVIVIISLMFIFSIIAGLYTIDDVFPEGGLSNAFGNGSVSFGVAWSNGESIGPIPFDVENPNTFRFLDYIFGEIPSYLIEWTNEFSASIIIIGIWFIFLLVFADSIALFGSFTPTVNWLIAIVLTVIVSNLKVIMALTVIVLSFTAILGSLSVLAAIAVIFGMFLAFHFGTSSMREKIIMRRAEGYALRASAGGDIAASGVSVLTKVAEQAQEAAKKTK